MILYSCRWVEKLRAPKNYVSNKIPVDNRNQILNGWNELMMWK